MNSVHEPCPNSDSEIVLSPKTGWVHQVHNQLTQPANPSAPRRARTGAVSWPLWPCRGPSPRPCRRVDGRVAGPQPAVSQACCAPCMAVSWPRSQHTLPHALFWSQYTAVYCNTKAQQRIAIQNPTIQPPKLQYNFPATAYPFQLCHDTISHCIVTQLGSSPTNSAPFFFRFFFILIFFSLLSSYYKHKEKYLSIFFPYSLVHLNKFLKIYFLHFFSVLHCKT